MSRMRKVRSDAILHGLPAAQRAKVDGWLFDKGLTYLAVAQACASVFGVKVSRSSVARYYERRMREELRRKRNATVARKSEGMNEEERYEALLGRMRDLAEEAAEQLKERRGWRWIVEITEVLIAARRERSQRIRAEVVRKKFEMKSAAACLRAYLKIPQGAAFASRMRDAKSLRAADLLPAGRVGSLLTARCGDARNSPPCLRPKSLAAEPGAIFQKGSEA